MGRKGQPQRTPLQLIKDRAEIGRLYLQGKSQDDIAQIMSIPRRTIRDDLDALREMWIKSGTVDFGERRAIEVAKLDRIEAEAWDAWEESKRPQRKSMTTRNQGGGYQGGNVNETVLQTETREGNPSYLALALKCVDSRIKLYGLNEPERVLTMSLELVKVYHGVDLDQV